MVIPREMQERINSQVIAAAEGATEVTPEILDAFVRAVGKEIGEALFIGPIGAELSEHLRPMYPDGHAAYATYKGSQG